jgi:hypothetical protein
MVADIHRTILYGVLYLPLRFQVPERQASSPCGNSDGYDREQAEELPQLVCSRGQMGYELVPHDIHAPDIMGSKRDVQQVYDQYAKAGVDVPKL